MPDTRKPADRLQFSIGGFFRESHELVSVTTQIRYTFNPHPGVWPEPQILTPEPDHWKAFWRDIEAAGVWRWQKRYDSEVLDGTQWELRLRHAGRSVHCYGSNAYPGCRGMTVSSKTEFGRFLTALRKLTGIKTIR